MAIPESLPTNADDRLPVGPLGRVEGGDDVVEGRNLADVCPQSSVPHSLDDLTQLDTIGLDNEVDARPLVGRASVGPTTDTRVPLARIRPADRFWMLPPMT